MPIIKAVLVPLDGSDIAECALPAAVNVTRRLNAFIHLVRVHAQGPEGELSAGVLALRPETEQAILEREERYLERVADQLRAEGLAVSTKVVKGEIVPALQSYAERHGIGLVVMSSHGRGGLSRALLGSIADDLIRTTEVPVLLVNPRTSARVNPSWPSRILVPLDGSEMGDSALDLLPVVDQGCTAKVMLTSVVQTIPPSINPWVFPPELFSDTVEQRDEQLRRYLTGTITRLRARGFHAGFQLVLGSKVAAEILKLAIWKRFDLILMSTHGAGGMDRVMFGSVADQVLRHTTVPVLVVHPAPRSRSAGSTGQRGELVRGA